MKALLVSGSRNPKGQTGQVAEALLRGWTDAGGQSDGIWLPSLRVERCRQCDDQGWGICRDQGRCVIEDDFASIVDRMRSADLFVFATPVYFSTLSESLRAFLDRLRRTCIADIGQAGIDGKPAVGICIAGGGGGGAPACVVDLEKVLHTCGLDVVDMIPGRRQNLELKCQMAATAGRWLHERK